MMLRTIRRFSLELNRAKWEALCELARRYRNEKNVHLPYYHVDSHFAADSSERTYRNMLVTARYASVNGLQSRMWKMAQKDAYETVGKQWAALREKLTPLIQRQADWSDSAKHYAHWLIYTPQRMAALMSGCARLPTKFNVPADEQKMVRNYLRRVIRRKRGRRPVAKTARSIAFDPNMYTLFEQDGRQYIALMSLQPKERIVVPLTGHTPIVGNIRVVLDVERRRVEIHYTAEVKAPLPLTGEPCGLDAGVSEVFTDEAGTRYGPDLGHVIGEASDVVCAKGRTRNKLSQMAKKAEARGDATTAKHVRQFNLGQKKLRQRTRRQRAEIARQINTAIHQVITHRHPAVVVVEKLDLRGKAKSKKISRRVNQWMRSTVKERIEFKASAE